MSFETATLSVEEFRLIRDLILRYCGVYLTDDQRLHTERRLRERLVALGLSDFRSYYRYLRFDAPGAAGQAQRVRAQRHSALDDLRAPADAAAASCGRSRAPSWCSTPLTYLWPSVPPKDLASSTHSLITTRSGTSRQC